jgi:sodium transport system permease protein
MKMRAFVRDTLVVAAKEARDAVRDQRAVLSALAYAVAGPLLVGAVVVSLTRDRSETAFRVGLAHADTTAELARALEAAGLQVVEMQDPASAVREGRVAVAIETDHRYAADLAAQRPAHVRLYSDSAQAVGRSRGARVRTALGRHSGQIADLRLMARGIAPAVASPLIVEERDVSTPQARFATALAMLPVFLMMAPFVCGLSAAIDAAAGERERGSLEPLLLSPVSRSAIALGKWGIVSAQAAIGTLVTAGVAFLVFRTPWLAATPVALEGDTVVRALALLLPLCPLAAAAMLLTALASRSFKEAQTQATVMMFVPMVPGLLSAVGTLTPKAWMSVMPLLGQQLLCMEVLRGDAISWRPALALTLLTSTLAVAAVIAIGRRLESDGAALVG